VRVRGWGGVLVRAGAGRRVGARARLGRGVRSGWRRRAGWVDGRLAAARRLAAAERRAVAAWQHGGSPRAAPRRSQCCRWPLHIAAIQFAAFAADVARPATRTVSNCTLGGKHQTICAIRRDFRVEMHTRPGNPSRFVRYESNSAPKCTMVSGGFPICAICHAPRNPARPASRAAQSRVTHRVSLHYPRHAPRNPACTALTPRVTRRATPPPLCPCPAVWQ
jgi:hypothetical protein